MKATLEALRDGDLAGVRHLKLDGGLTEIPREVFGLADSLEVLDLSGNALTALPQDFARLKALRVLFCSNNRFAVLPEVLGDCATLTQIGFRGVGMSTLPLDALPPKVRWLTLTDNALETLPDGLGERRTLQKVMFSGNRLRALPKSLADAPNLGLLRLAANRFERLPPWLADLPRLAWLAFSGNPMDQGRPAPETSLVHWQDLKMDGLLGEGASGQVFRTLWNRGPDAPDEVAALKLFKGAMTSDGLPEREMAACLAAGEHPNLIGARGRLRGHPEGREGLLMPLLPPEWRILADPPSLETCSRDVYKPEFQLDLEVAIAIAGGIGDAATHLHQRNILHGDLYAHNALWDGALGHAVLSDFGAATLLPSREEQGRYRALDVLAWGILLGELLDRVRDRTASLARYRAVQRNCEQPNPALRPSLSEALESLAA